MALFKNFSRKRIPTILGLLLLVAGLGTGLYLVGQATIIPRAAAGETPKEIKITNISENSFTVSWITDAVTTGFVRVGSTANKLDRTVTDDRDQLSGGADPFLTHHVTVGNLRPDTNYYFKLGSGTSRVLYDNNGEAYLLSTPSVLGTSPAADTVYGTVLELESTPASGAIVYLTLPNAAPLSAQVKSTGNWAVSLSTSRTSDLSAYVAYDRQATTLELFVQGGSGQVATAVTVTANDSPVPPITLGQDHDFRSDVPEGQELEGEPGELPPGADVGSGLGLSSEPDASPSGTPDDTTKFSFGSLGPALPETSTFELDILNPEQEGEEMATAIPEIFGTSPKNVTLTIVVESPTTYTDTLAVGDKGLWQWTPPAGLDPGEHTVTVSYTDEQGILQRVQRGFVVLAAEGESLPSFEATPSASASPSATPAPRVSQPSTESGVPVAGILTPTLTLFILGAGLLAVGLFWQLKLNQL